MSILKKASIVLGVTLACSLIGFLIISGLQVVFPENSFEQANFMKAILVVGHLFTFVLSAILLANIFGKSTFIRYAPFYLKLNGVLLTKFIVLMALCYPIAGLSAALMAQLDLPSWLTSLDDKNIGLLKQLMRMEHYYDFIVNIFVVALLPGIGEEMLFRGVLQNELQKSMSNRYWPLVIAALIFAAFHLEPTGLITKFLIGCVLGYAYLITKNIFYPIIIHVLNNALQVGILYFTDGIEGMDINIPQPDLAQWIGAVVTIPLIYQLIKHINYEYQWIKS